MVLELNASDDRGIDVVRNQIKDFCSTQKIFSSGTKLVILDEADSMTSPAQAALRRMIERYTKNVRFCLLGNYVSKIIPALQSRCTKFRFQPVDPAAVEARMGEICALEGVRLADGAMDALHHLAQGDFRKYLNILQATTLAGPGDEGAMQTEGALRVTAEMLYACTGNPSPVDLKLMVDSMEKDDVPTCSRVLNELRENKGFAVVDILRGLHRHVMQDKAMSEDKKRYLLIQMAKIEENVLTGCNEKLQLGLLLSIMIQSREIM